MQRQPFAEGKFCMAGVQWMCQVFYENLTCSASHLPKANFAWLVFNGKENVIMEIRKAAAEDFDIVFDFIEKLWTYNTYDREEIRKVYMDVINDERSFAFLLWDEGICRGMCHGDYFNTFWMSGLTCYVSSLITREEDRGKGYGVALLDHAKELAKQRGCKAITLDSGLPRTGAHGFYEHYGFEKSCYGFELMI